MWKQTNNRFILKLFHHHFWEALCNIMFKCTLTIPFSNSIKSFMKLLGWKCINIKLMCNWNPKYVILTTLKMLNVSFSTWIVLKYYIVFGHSAILNMLSKLNHYYRWQQQQQQYQHQQPQPQLQKQQQQRCLPVLLSVCFSLILKGLKFWCTLHIVFFIAEHFCFICRSAISPSWLLKFFTPFLDDGC